MATTSIRSEVKAALVSTITAALPGVQVSQGWPGRGIEPEFVAVANVSGTMSLPLMQAGRKPREDDFVISILIGTAKGGRDTIEEVEARALELLAVVEDALADDPSLGEIDGVLWMAIERVDGPNSEITTEGPAAFLTVEIAVRSRLS
jgi:hypothetical protein